jgi:hypothetical protein
LLARYEIVKKTRPPSQSRFGSVCERLFGVANTRFIYNLAGNTQMTKGNLRLITKEVDPKNLAVWTFGSLEARLREWAYEVYVRNHWRQCHSEHYLKFQQRTERELMIAAAELRRRNQQHGKRLVITAHRLASFLSSVEAEELTLQQRLRDAEVMY